ncbi:site-2 protease family protein [Herpetosiphon gulosus]|uniref:Peptidase M50 n=1 Tax=Herpetosiphon gulosus TaxID=1973496 RepID=A0ABP9WXF9_9CHLR
MQIDLNTFVMRLVAIVLGVTIHEFSHAFVALRLGDPTAAQEGRVSLNPVVHFDPLGAFMMFFVMLGYAPMAWGRPVPINVFRIRWGRRGFALSSLAGPTSNLLLASIFAIPLYINGGMWLSEQLYTFLYYVIITNIGLAAFNMLPLPPLDGFNTFAGLLPQGWATPMERLRRPANIILMILILLPWMINRLNLGQLDLDPRILDAMIAPIYQLFQRIVLPFAGCCHAVGHNHDHAEA